jgi:hypothetical protein
MVAKRNISSLYLAVIMEVVMAVATTATDLQAAEAVAMGEAEVDTEVATVMVHPVEEVGAEVVEAARGIEGLLEVPRT